MTDARRQDNHIAGRDYLDDTIRSAEPKLRRAAVATQHFVGVAVVMRIRIDAVSPRFRPAVRLEDCLQDQCAVAILFHNDIGIIDHRKPGMIGNVSVVLKAKLLWFNVIEKSGQIARHAGSVFR